MMGFWEAVRTCFNKYYDFTGRARRSEYCWFFLFTMLAILLWMLFGTLLLALPIGMAVQHLSGNESAVVTIMMVIMFLPMLFLLLPSLAVQVRRLHDTGRSGWWVVASIILQIVASALPFILFGTGALDLGFKEEFTKPFEVSTLAGVSNATFYIASEVLSIILLIFSIFDSHKTENKYGPSPKYQNISEENTLTDQ
jgi:uncharacterized membrane protein YhaH (DUF805 family)